MLLFSASPARAQSAASISGTVADSSGTPIAAAAVTVTNLETEAKRAVATDASGGFRILSLPVGVYELRAQKAGFDDALWTGIKLDVGQSTVENVQLAISTAMQEVTVVEQAAPASVVNTTTSSVSGLVNEEEVKELPLNGRGFDKLITLNPGTTDYSPLRSSNTTTSNGSAFSVDGQKPADNLFLLNGIEISGASQLAVTPGGVSGNLLGVDAVREFNMLSGAYGAEYGKRSGAQVVVVTQSGNNAVHGTLYEYLRNNVLDARNFFDNGPAHTYQRNQFGASLGAPLKKDKLFFFGNYEGFRQRGNPTGTSVSFVPDAQARLGNLPCTAGGPLKCPTGVAPGTEEPVPNLKPAMLKYMQMWPQPDVELGGGVAKSFNNPRQSTDEDFGTARFDYILGARDTLSGSYTADQGNSLLPLADPLFASALSVGYHVFSLQETHVFSPHVVNSAIFGFSRASFSNDSAPFVSFDPSLDLVLGRGPGGIVIGGGVTTTGGGSITAAGPNNASGVSSRRNLFTFADNVQISTGRHQISLGVWLQRLQDNENTASRQLGQASFSSLASFMTGNLSSFQVVPSATELGWRSFLGAWYVEDAVKVRHNLMVRLGIRHEFDSGWNEAHGRASNFFVDPATGALITVPHVGTSAFSDNNATKLFGPRVGLAWDVFGNGSTAVHAGFGMYYSLLDALAFQLNSNPPFNGSISLSGSLPGIAPYDPTAPIAAQCGTPGAPAPPACTKFSPQGVQQNAKVPTLEKWNLSVEQRLTNTMMLTVGYVGSFGYHELLNTDPNTIQPVVCTTVGGCNDAGGVLASGLAAPASSVPQGTQYVPVGRRPNRNLSSGFFWFTDGNSSYNALQIDVTKRYSKKLQFRANYTWSKSLDINSAPTGAQANNQAQMVLNRFDLHRDWGPSALNPAHLAHFTATYELPFGRGQRWLPNAKGAADKLASGWVLNMITTLQSGFPLTPQVGSNISGTGDTRNPDRPNFATGFSGHIVKGSVSQWFDPTAYALPLAGTFGNVGRGSLTGPGYADVDVSLNKETQIAERFKMEFRAECFNLLNHANFNTPNLIVFSNGAISPTAGQISSTASTSRQLQFGLKLIY